MKDIQLDSDGNFRCWNCGGRNFSEKRTRRSKVVGAGAGVVVAPVAAVGILAAKKRLWCQACAEYNKMGNAQPYTPRTAAPKNGKVSKNEPSEASTLLGVVMIAAAVVGLTAWAVSAHAWWWLIVLVPALLFVLLGLAGMILELKPKRRRDTLAATKRSESKEPKAAGWYPDSFQEGRERWWSGTAWTNQTRWP